MPKNILRYGSLNVEDLPDCSYLNQIVAITLHTRRGAQLKSHCESNVFMAHPSAEIDAFYMFKECFNQRNELIRALRAKLNHLRATFGPRAVRRLLIGGT